VAFSKQDKGSVKTMADVFLFIQNAWKNIWKQKTIWLFSALSILNQWIFSFQIKPESKLLGGLLSLGVFLIYIRTYAKDI